MAVYIIRHGRLFKIGYTEDWTRRYRTFQRQNQFSGEVQAVLVTSNELGRSAESALHNQFAPYRLPGTEWFWGEGDVAACIDLVAQWRDELWVEVSAGLRSQATDPLQTYYTASDMALQRLYNSLTGGRLPTVRRSPVDCSKPAPVIGDWVEPTDEFKLDRQSQCDLLIEVIEELKADIAQPTLDRKAYSDIEERITTLCRDINYGLYRDWNRAEWEGKASREG